MVKGTATRQSNGSAFFPQLIWENLKIEVGEEFEWSIEEKTKGMFVAFYKSKKKGT